MEQSLGRRPALVALAGATVLGALLATARPAGAADGEPTAVLLKDVNAGTANSSPTRFVQVGSNVLFIAAGTGVGQEWRTTDGTTAGTTLLKDIMPGATGSTIRPGVQTSTEVVGGNVFFGANGGGGVGNELWKTDGTAAGTVLVKDINPLGDGITVQSEFRAVGATMYFLANDGVTGLELWKSDGTAAGTVQVKDIAAGPLAGVGSGAGAMLTAVGGTLFFAANDGTTGPELWKSDGTAAGTVLVKDVLPGAGDPLLLSLTALGPDLVFRATDGTSGSELWKSDGTTAGTILVKDIVAGSGNSQPTSFTVVGASLFFAANDGTGISAHGNELWKTDGTAAGTVLVKDIIVGGGSSNPQSLIGFGSLVLFRATASAAVGGELWRSDGTAAGTVLVKDINPGASNGAPTNFAVLGSTAFFQATNGTTGTELWRTDATAAGTVLVRDINPGTAGSMPAQLTPALGTIYFAATDGTLAGAHGLEPWYVRHAPLAVDDAYSTSEDTALTVPAPGVLGNDTDADGDPITAGSAGTPAHGSVTLNPDGSFTYTPAADYYGPDTFTYVASDGLGGTDTATVRVTVTPVNDAGPIANDDAHSTNEDSPLTVSAPGVLGNDTDVDADPLTAGSASDPANGSVILNADGSFTYTPDADFSGSDSFTYKANDGTLDSGEATVTIAVAPVNDAPLAADDAYTTGAGSPLTVGAPGVLGNDGDVDGDPLTAGSASDPANGSVTLDADGSFTYTTDLGGFSGTDTFTYVASDGQGGTDTATVTITITPDPTPTSVSVSNVSVFEGDAGTTAATFTITRSGNATGSSSVGYKTSGGTATAEVDYAAVPLSTLTFAPFETTKTVTVDVATDTVPEANETFNLVLSAPTGTVIADMLGTATIVNDDGAAYLSVANVTVIEGNTGTSPATPATFTITRSGNTGGTSTVKYKTGGGTATAGSDYTAVPLTTVIFDPGDTTKTVTVDVTGDLTDEANENFSLTLSAPTGATIGDAGGVGYVTDDDGAVNPAASTFHSVDSITVDEGNAGTAAATFTVSRTGDTSGPSTVKYRTNGGSATAGTDYTAVPLTTLSFAAGATSQTVTVDVAGDTLPEANETFNLVLSAATGGVVSDGTGTATIVNDDGAAYLSVGNTSVTEGDTGTATVTFTITRSGNPSGSSTVTYRTTNGTATAGTDYTAVAPTTVTFAPGETTKTVTVDVAGDTTVEKNETFNLVLSAPSGATIADASGAATIINDD